MRRIVSVKPERPLILSICLFIIIQTYIFVWHSFPLAKDETDGLHYINYSYGNLFHIDPYHGPGYSLFIRFFRCLGFPAFSSAKIVSMISGLTFIVACWFILRKFSTTYHLLIYILVIALNKTIITYSNMILSDMLASACFIASIALFVYPKRVYWWHCLIAGVLVGTAYLTRYIFIFVLTVPVLYYITMAKQISLRDKAKCFIAFYSAFSAIIAPWVIYLHNLKGNMFWNLNHLNMAFKLIRDKNDWANFPSLEQYPNFISVVAESPVLFVKSWLFSILSLPGWVLKMFPVIGLFGAVGLFTWWRKTDPARRFVGYVSGGYICLISLVWFEYRFLIPLIPLFSIFIADGICFSLTVLRNQLNKKKKNCHSQALTITGITCILLIILVPTIKHTYKRFSDIPFEYKTTSEHLRELCSSEDLVFAGKPHIAVFAQARNYEFRNAGMDKANWMDLPAILDKINPTYVVFDERYALKKFPLFQQLITPESKPFPLLLEHVFTVSTPQKVVVYRYLKTQSTVTSHAI